MIKILMFLLTLSAVGILVLCAIGPALIELLDDWREKD